MVEKEEKKGVSEATLIEVPTQTTIAFKLEDESLVDEKGMLLKIYQDIQKIKKSIA